MEAKGLGRDEGTQVGKGLICKVNEFGFSERDGEQSGLWTLST